MNVGTEQTVKGRRWVVLAKERRVTNGGQKLLLVWASGCRACGGPVVSRTTLQGLANSVMQEGKCRQCITDMTNLVPDDAADDARRYAVEKAITSVLEGVDAAYFEEGGLLWAFTDKAC